MVTEIIYDVPQTQQDFLLDRSGFTLAPPNSFITVATYEEHGFMTRRTMETSEHTTVCASDVPAVGSKLATSYGRHALLWVDDYGVAVLLQANRLERVKPLSKEPVISQSFFPEGIQPTDVFQHPENTKLIYIGFEREEEAVQEVQYRTGISDVVYISVNEAADPRDAWTREKFAVTYDRDSSQLNIFPVSGDEYMSLQIGNITSEVYSPFYARYREYFRNGGTITRPFMRDAYNLSYEDMQKIYPRNELYLATPEEYAAQVAQTTRASGIEFTNEQIRLYVNLRGISSEIQQAVYKYGPTPPMRRAEETGSGFVHPITLEVIGLLGQVLLFTQDKNRERRLQKYLRSIKSRY